MELPLLDILQTEILDGPETLTAESDLFAAGLDSMGIMQLLIAIEDHFEVTIDPSELSRENFASASRIAALVRSKK